MPDAAPGTHVTSRLHAASPVCESLLSGRNIHVYCIGLPVYFQVFRCKNCKLPVGTAAMGYAGVIIVRKAVELLPELISMRRARAALMRRLRRLPVAQYARQISRPSRSADLQIRGSPPLHLPLDPGHKQIHEAPLLILRELHSRTDSVPLFQAASAAACAGVLRLEDRMPAHRRLPAVVRDHRRSQTLCDKILRMEPYRVHALFLYVRPVSAVEMKLRPKIRFPELFQRLIYSLHSITPWSQPFLSLSSESSGTPSAPA